MMEPDIIQRFLESVGQKADVDLYLRLHRAERKESFAIIAADAQIVKTALDPVHFDLRILAGLGLLPVVMLGLYEAKDADRQAERVLDWLLEDAVPARIVASGADIGADTIAAVRAAIADGAIPLVSLEGVKEAATEARFRLLAALAEALETRKVIFLSRRAGLIPQGVAPDVRLSLVTLAADYERVIAAGTLSRRQTLLLKQIKHLLERVPHRMSATVVNPLHLLRELFTTGGAGTLIRRGSRIETFSGWDGVDRARLRGLFESAFGRSLDEQFFAEPVERLYVEEAYRGAAAVRATTVGPYLTKFAVERQAQGEGLGTELWSLLVRDFPTFFWRARPTNPISPWYVKQCEGMARFPEWQVFWRGLPVEGIDPAVRYALGAPSDFG
jgi:acetylglutamate kinase